jgi:hypothetical protein
LLRSNKVLDTAQVTKPNQLLFIELTSLELNLRLPGTLFRKNKNEPNFPAFANRRKKADDVRTEIYPH